MSSKFLFIYISTLIAYNFGIPLTKLNENVGDNETDIYRLPKTIIPSQYLIDLKLETDAFTTTNFTGTVIIIFDVANENVSHIKLHSKYIDIKSVNLKLNNETIAINTGPYISDSETDILTIQTTNQLNSSATGYSLTINYIGKLSESDMAGFYKSSYDEGGKKKYLATTQFESTSARRAFPCFDEPSFKANFILSITYPNIYNALANTPQDGNSIVTDNLTTTKFKTTPKMSTYLLAFIVSEFTCTEGKEVEQGVPTSVCSRNETAKTREWALELAPQILQKLQNYTGFNYTNSNIGKMTQEAIPDFAAGAMENWGLVTYRETALLWDKEESSNDYKFRVASVIAHEFSHMWFGDLVTLGWWSNLFLNEGFADFFEYISADQVLPDWELLQQFVIREIHAALSADVNPSSLALSSYVSTPSNISGRFDDISYKKGASVYWMVQHFISPEKFQSGIQKYIAKYQYNNTTPENLWESLGENASVPDNLTLNQVMSNWTYKSGFPVLTVMLHKTSIHISQKRLLSSGSSDTKWYVPISYTLSNDANKFIDTTPKAWLTPNSDVMLNDVFNESKWIILNNQQTAFYRVNYVDELWTRISDALLENLDQIHVINRAQIVDDLMNLAKVKEIKYSRALELLQFLKNDISYYPWYAAFNGLSYLQKRTANDELTTALVDYISDLMENFYDSANFDQELPDDQIFSLKQILSITWACKLDKSDCIDESKKRFEEYKINGTRPFKNFRSTVYCTALQNSDDIGTDWNFLWEKFTESLVSTEQVTILSALGCTKNETILNNYLNKIITANSGIRIQDASTAFSAVYTNNIEGVDIAFNFIKENLNNITSYFGSSSTAISWIGSIADRFINEEQIDALSEFIDSENVDEDIKQAGKRAIESAKSNLEEIKLAENDLLNFFSLDRDSATSRNTNFVIILLLTIFASCYQYVL